MSDDPAQFAIVPLPEPGTARDALLRDAIAFGGSDELLRQFFSCEEAGQRLAAERQRGGEPRRRYRRASDGPGRGADGAAG